MLSHRRLRTNYAKRSPTPFPGRVGMTTTTAKSATSAPGKPASWATTPSSSSGPTGLAPACRAQFTPHSEYHRLPLNSPAPSPPLPLVLEPRKSLVYDDQIQPKPVSALEFARSAARSIGARWIYGG